MEEPGVGDGQTTDSQKMGDGDPADSVGRVTIVPPSEKPEGSQGTSSSGTEIITPILVLEGQSRDKSFNITESGEADLVSSVASDRLWRSGLNPGGGSR